MKLLLQTSIEDWGQSPDSMTGFSRIVMVDRFFLKKFAILWISAFIFCAVAVSVCHAITLPEGFQEDTVFSGLNNPTAVRFASDGRVFITEKRGYVKIFNGLSDNSADILIDLRTNVYDQFDRGLLGLAIDPDFPTRPYIYVMYTYDFDPFFIGPQPPRWNDNCTNPPGPFTDGCVVNGRISKLEVAPDNTLIGAEQVLLENNWCQQYSSHSIGQLQFGPEGALYATAGDGASFSFTDYGQKGIPKNPCEDPPLPSGQLLTPPTAEGGALRSQDLRTMTDPVTYDGSVLRINPDTGAAWPTNPLVGANPEDDRIIAYGLRNPFRFTIRPNSSQVWVGDVGWDTWEELNKISDPEDANVENFGWPCYEGNNRQSGYDGPDLNICENLYSEGSATLPYYVYEHDEDFTPGVDCPTDAGSSVTGVAFYVQGVYPSDYEDALFFADYSRDCIYLMRKGIDGDPDTATRTVFGLDAKNPVHLEIGPGGDLFYVDLGGGKIRRIEYFVDNQPPTAVAQATPIFGIEPLLVQFDASNSTDPDPGSTLFYEWDLDADGQYDDSTVVNPQYTYTVEGQYEVRLKVTDDDGANDTNEILITVGNTPPTATILSPSPTLQWRVGQVISFSGEGNDPEEGLLPLSSMHWEIILHHCPGGTGQCHEHPIQQLDGISGGLFTAPDHEWDAFLEFRLTVTDSGIGNLSDETTVSIDPETVLLTYDTDPSGLELVVGGIQETTPFNRTAIIGSLNSVSAITPQDFGGSTYHFVSWSDGGAQSHEIIAGEIPATYSAKYCTVITISPATLPGAVAAQPYNQSLSAAGGTGPYTFTVTSGSLPNGITLSSSGGLSGTPLVTGTFDFAVQVSDSNNCTAVSNYSIDVVCGTLSLSPSSLPAGNVAVSYGQNVATTGGVEPYVYFLSDGSLPNGLSLSAAGALSGIPTTTGTFNFTVTSSDSNGCAGIKPYQVIISCGAMMLSPSSLPDGAVAIAYTQTLIATGGSAPFGFALTSGALPGGLSLSSNGVLSGIPTTTGTFNFTVTATDTNGCPGNRAYTITIECGTVVLSPSSLPDATEAVPYSQSLTVAGGTNPFTFTVGSGMLPDGLTLSSDGNITGTPIVTGTFNFTILATDANGCPGSQPYSVPVVCGTITPFPSSLPGGTVDNPYTESLSASGGIAPYIFTISSGTLPSGLTLSADGLISGTPTSASTFNFNVLVTDANNCSGNKAYSINTLPLLLDDFTGPVVDWEVQKGTWSQVDGKLVGTGNSKAIAYAPIPWDPSGHSGCSMCTIRINDVEISGGDGDKLTILGWYMNDKNKIEVIIKEATGKVILRQKVNGQIVAKEKFPLNITAGTPFDIEIALIGSDLNVTVGNEVFVISYVGQPSGKVGFSIMKTTVSFGGIQID